MDVPIHILNLKIDPTYRQRIQNILPNDSIDYQLLVVDTQPGFKMVLTDVTDNIILAGCIHYI